MSESASPMTIPGERSFEWQITLFKEINDEEKSDEDVSVMIFQAFFPEPPQARMRSCAWWVVNVPSPGQVGPLKLPRRVQFGALDKVKDDVSRLAGPVDVDFGQSVKVSQQNNEQAAEIKISENSQRLKEITATNSRDSLKPLEMALYKRGKKLVAYENVIPDTSVSFLFKTEDFYVMDGTNFTKGQNFKPSDEIEKATKFSLSPEKKHVNIKITRKSSAELEFTESKPVLDA